MPTKSSSQSTRYNSLDGFDVSVIVGAFVLIIVLFFVVPYIIRPAVAPYIPTTYSVTDFDHIRYQAKHLEIEESWMSTVESLLDVYAKHPKAKMTTVFFLAEFIRETSADCEKARIEYNASVAGFSSWVLTREMLIPPRDEDFCRPFDTN